MASKIQMYPAMLMNLSISCPGLLLELVPFLVLDACSAELTRQKATCGPVEKPNAIGYFPTWSQYTEHMDCALSSSQTITSLPMFMYLVMGNSRSTWLDLMEFQLWSGRKA